MTVETTAPSRESAAVLALLALAPAVALADSAWSGIALALAVVLGRVLGGLATRLAGPYGGARVTAAVLGCAVAAVIAGQLAHAFAFPAWTAAGAALPVAVAAAALLRPGGGGAATGAVAALGAAATLVAVGALREFLGAGTIAGTPIGTPEFPLAASPAAGLLALGAILALVRAVPRPR